MALAAPAAARLTVLVAVLLAAAPAAALDLGVMGDSLSDEYAEETYGAYAENWVEQLAAHGGVDLGPTAAEAGQPGGSWEEPRRTRYEHDWARSGANSVTLLSGGQHTGLAADVTANAIGYAVLAIGANDFYPGGSAYQNIYLGTWSQAQIDVYVDGVLANIDTALDTVLPTGVALVLVNAPDYGLTPTVRGYLPSVVGRQRVANAISQLNVGIDAIGQARSLPVVDLFGAAQAIFGTHASPRTTLLLGNVSIGLDQSDTAAGGNPTAGFVHDGVHPNTTLQGIFANAISSALNLGYGAGFPIFSEGEILAHRGLAYGGADTLAAQIGGYSDYVANYAPPPPVPSLSSRLAALLGLLIVAAHAAALRRPAARYRHSRP